MNHFIFSSVLLILIGDHLCSAQSWNHVPVEKHPQRERPTVPYRTVAESASPAGYYDPAPKEAAPQYAYYEAQLYPQQAVHDPRALAYPVSDGAYKSPQHYPRNEYLESVTPNPNQIPESYVHPQNHWNPRPAEYVPVAAHGNEENLEQYHIELTSAQHARPAPVQPQKNIPSYQPAQPHYAAQPKYQKVPRVQAYQDPLQKQLEAEAIARAQAQAQEDALKFQKINTEFHLRHQQAALHQFKIDSDRYRQQQAQQELENQQQQHRQEQAYQQQLYHQQQEEHQPQPQQSALEQIQEGYVSKAGQEHIVKEFLSRDPHAYGKPSLRAQATAKLAAARKAQEVAEHKAHADAILHLQRQQQAHLKAQEDAEKYALNFEKNQIKAQALAQKIANAQAKSLYEAYQAERAKARKQVELIAHAQLEARKKDPEHAPVIQYLLEENSPRSH